MPSPGSAARTVHWLAIFWVCWAAAVFLADPWFLPAAMFGLALALWLFARPRSRTALAVSFMGAVGATIVFGVLLTALFVSGSEFTVVGVLMTALSAAVAIASVSTYRLASKAKLRTAAAVPRLRERPEN